MSKFPCTFCGIENSSKASRRTHNKSCAKNVNREVNAAKSKAANEAHKKWMDENPRPTLDVDTFSDIFDDLPDGAFFAMAEEHGLSVEDFID